MTGYAIRNPKRGKAHRATHWQAGSALVFAACGRCYFRLDLECVPVDQVDPADRCRTCWKEEA